MRQLEGPEIIQITVDKIQIVKQCMKAAQDRQKSYADLHRRDIEYAVGDRVFLKVSPWKGILRFGRHGKLSPRYIGPYEVIERVELWLINWLYLQSYRRFIMYFMFRCLGGIDRILCMY